MFYLTSRDTKTVHVRRTPWGLGILLIGISIMNILKPTRKVSTTSGSKVMAQTVIFIILVTLTLTFVQFFVTRTRQKVLESPCEVS